MITVAVVSGLCALYLFCTGAMHLSVLPGATCVICLVVRFLP